MTPDAAEFCTLPFVILKIFQGLQLPPDTQTGLDADPVTFNAFVALDLEISLK